MLEAIVHKALDYACFLPTCDESNSLGLKALKVALPVIGTIVAIGITKYKFSQRNKLTEASEERNKPQNSFEAELERLRVRDAQALADQRATFQASSEQASVNSQARLHILHANLSSQQKRQLLVSQGLLTQ